MRHLSPLVWIAVSLSFLAGSSPAQAAAPATLLLAHAHNDYNHVHPLFDALAHRYGSVEADIYLRDGDLKVAHAPWDSSKGTLRELYLDPLQALVDRQGSVYGDGAPFTLWIDIKSISSSLAPMLRAQLAAYPMLTVFTDAGIQRGPVTVVLTGNDANQERVLSIPGPRYACRDRGTFGAGDPPADTRWLWYALDWSKLFKWNGIGTIPVDERLRLRQLVWNIHFKQRFLRFYAAPQTPAFWQETREAGSDLLGSDDLASLADFLSAKLIDLWRALTELGGAGR